MENFLNKKYVNVHSFKTLSHSHSRSSRTFVPSHQPSQLVNSQNNQQLSNSHINSHPNLLLSNNIMASNHCTSHPQQLIRHLCLDCIQLLCSQCIGEHITIHRESNTFPNIQTLKQLKLQMNNKVQDMMGYIFNEKNHPKYMFSNVDSIRKESLERISILKRDLIQMVQQWIQKLRESAMNNVGYEQIRIIQQQMYSLHQQVNHLINSLSSNNTSVHDIKKAYQIDADRLQKTYKQMLDKYTSLSESMKIMIDLDSKKFGQGLQQAIKIKLGKKIQQSGIKVSDNENQDLDESQIDLPLQIKNNMDKETIPFLFNFISGLDVFKIINPSSKGYQIKSYQLQGVEYYPLNSVSLLKDKMVIISGGMKSQNQKSDLVQLFDYQEGKLVSQYKLIKGRSSHRTIQHNYKIYFIGGFNSENQECRQVQILTPDGIVSGTSKCKWGGPNLCIKLKGNILKITVSGVEQMNLDTLAWEQITTDVPFALSKGMQIAKYVDKEGKQIVIIFGDDQFMYKWDMSVKKFQKLESNMGKPVMCGTTKNNIPYIWVQDYKITIFKLQSQKWVEVEQK